MECFDFVLVIDKIVLFSLPSTLLETLSSSSCVSWLLVHIVLLCYFPGESQYCLAAQSVSRETEMGDEQQCLPDTDGNHCRRCAVVFSVLGLCRSGKISPLFPRAMFATSFELLIMMQLKSASLESIMRPTMEVYSVR